MHRIKNVCYCLGICIVLVLCGGCKSEEKAVLQEIQEEDTKEKEVISTIVQCIYVCGAVERPGVYELPAGSRVYEALEAAGGMTPEADQTYLNQAEFIEDGQQIYVPAQEETTTVKTTDKQGKVNINTATIEELMTLTGIGEAKAGSIIQYRETNGKFHSIEELMQIEGIKRGVFNKIKEQIVVK